MTDIQISPSTFIDNDVMNLTPHQIEFLRTVASRAGFSGLLEPDLNKSRSRGAFICSWFEGTARRTCLVGLHRTMPWPQEEQLSQLRKNIIAGDMENLNKARRQFSFSHLDNNDMDAIHDHLTQTVKSFDVAHAENMEPRDMLSRAYNVASQFIIYGNLMFARHIQANADGTLRETD